VFVNVVGPMSAIAREVHIVHPLRRRIQGKAGFRGLGEERWERGMARV
jgi:hypothetical protein